MNTPRSLAALVLFLAAVFLTTTAFQCGTAEMTTAKLAIQQNQLGKAEESLLRELQKNDKNEEAWFLLGDVRYKVKNFTGMNDAFTRALQLSETHKTEISRYRLDVWAQSYNRGIEYFNKGRDTASYYARSIQEFDLAVAVNPDSASTYYVRALSKYNNDDLAGADADVKKALAINPRSSEATRLQGSLYREEAAKKLAARDSAGARAAYTKAAATYEAAYRADPTSSEFIVLLIEAYDQAGMSDKALTLTQGAVERDPNNYIYRFASGVFLLRQNSYEQSIAQFTKALEIKPDEPEATYNCGVAYLNWGVAMKGDAEKAAAAKGKDAKVDEAYKEKFRKAVPYLERAAKTRKEDYLLHQQLGRVYAHLNMPKEAKAAFDEADRILKNQ